MKRSILLFPVFSLLFIVHASAQKKTFTLADTLRGSITPERAWWDVLKYDVTVKPDFESKTITGNVALTIKVKKNAAHMQIDLQQPLEIDSFIVNGKMQQDKLKSGGICDRRPKNGTWA